MLTAIASWINPRAAADAGSSRSRRHALLKVRHTYMSAYVSIRQHTSAYVSMRQHTSAYAANNRRHALLKVRADVC